MQSNLAEKYLQYSKRIAIFGICQWAFIATIALIITLLASKLGVYFDEWTMRAVNNIVTCSSALSIAICSGYYAHSAYDNNLKQRVAKAFEDEPMSNRRKSDNG